MVKKRLDLLLTERGLFPSREAARLAIMAGEVLVNNITAPKAGMAVGEDCQIQVKADPCPYVSRGGWKLAKALQSFNLDLRGAIVLDVGASTGGFTDCALQAGAAKVYAVDVGYGQLAWKLRCDERVIVLEKTNARYLTEEQITEKVDFVTIDASFISLQKLLPAAIAFLRPKGKIIALIKPQFEAGRQKVGKGGVVKDSSVHVEVINEVINFASTLGLAAQALTFSPIKGPQGNIEYLILLDKNVQKQTIAVECIVSEAEIKLTK